MVLIDGSPKGVWNIMEITLTVVFFMMGFYFLSKYKKGKSDNAPESVNDFNIGYAFFFWANALNQFFYIADTIPNFTPRLNDFFSDGDFYLFVPGLDPIGLKNQIVLMIVLLLISAAPLMRSIELYLKKREKNPMYKATKFGAILISIIYIIFYVVNRGIAPEGFDGDTNKYNGGIDGTPGLIINWILILIVLYIMIIALIIIWNIFIYWLILTIKAPKGAFRAKTLMIFLGILTLYLGLFVGNLLRPDLTGWWILIGPISFLTGMILLVIGFNKEIL